MAEKVVKFQYLLTFRNQLQMDEINYTAAISNF